MTEFPDPDTAYTKKQYENDPEMKRPYKLAKLVENEVIEGEYSRSEKPPQVFAPSAVGYCKRQMYNRKMNITDMDRYIQGILHAGTVNHFWLEHHLPELAESRRLGTERKFRKEINIDEEDFNLYIHGFADAVDSEGYVYDHKFTGAPHYKKNSPGEKDKRQVMMYIYCLSDAKVGRLEYNKRDGKFEKDDKNHQYHSVFYEPKTMQKMIDNMVEVAKAVKERKGTELAKVNPFGRCSRDKGNPCFYCQDDHEDTSEEVHEILSDLGVWDEWVEGESIKISEST